MNTSRWPEAPPTRRILVVALLLVAMTGTLLLCVGTGDFTLAVVVGCAVCLSFYLTEWTGLLRMGPLMANAAALVAITVAGLDFIRGGREGQLIAIANLLVYLQIILLFQEKTPRVYWHIILLSLLQVVVGAALSLSATFGLLLLGFVLVAVFTWHAFFVASELGQFDEQLDAPGPPQTTASATSSHPTRSSGRRWPYAGLPVSFAPVPATTHDRRAGGLRRLTTTTLTTLAFSLPVAAIVFLSVPRMGRDPWRGGPAQQQRVVGFSQEVRLGELGNVSENPEVVMRVKFIDPRTDRGFPLENTPMLRGTVVTTYDEGRWTHHGKRFETTVEDLDEPPRRRQIVLQEISLEPLNEPVVFSVYPAYAASKQPVVYDTDREQLVREPESLQRARLNLQIETTGFEGHRQAEIMPADRLIHPDRFSMDHFRLTAMPSQDRGRSLNTLVDVTERALADAGALESDRYTICRTLERYLQSEGGFTYTLASPPRTPGLDPVEDFVTNNRTGNCEYFATALALMLRSRGIPTRVVIGYQGGEWNPVGQFYQFRQLHAHSWVEAYLGPDEVAPHVENPRRYRRGGWLRLDPTAITLAPETKPTGVLARLRQGAAYAELVWVKYVVGLNSRRQQQTLYGPVQQTVARLIDPATFVDSIQARLIGWYSWLRDWLRGNWFSWRGGIFAMFVCALGFGAVRSLQALVHALRRARRNKSDAHRKQEPVVPFYAQLERIFAATGITRSAGQTQREFAMSVAGHLAESAQTRPHAGLPRRIVDAFYGVRFGRRPLSAAEEEEVSAALAALETSLRPGRD